MLPGPARGCGHTNESGRLPGPGLHQGDPGLPAPASPPLPRPLALCRPLTTVPPLCRLLRVLSRWCTCARQTQKPCGRRPGRACSSVVRLRVAHGTEQNPGTLGGGRSSRLGLESLEGARPCLIPHPRPFQEKRDSLPTAGWRSRWMPCPGSLGLAAWPAQPSEHPGPAGLPALAGRGRAGSRHPSPQIPTDEKLIYSSVVPGVCRVGASSQVPPSLGSAHRPVSRARPPCLCPVTSLGLYFIYRVLQKIN